MISAIDLTSGNLIHIINNNTKPSTLTIMLTLNNKHEHIKPTCLTATDLKFDLLQYSAKKLDYFISTCHLIDYSNFPLQHIDLR